MISVIIPAWNAARYLGDAISSVLAQSPRPLEVLVIDDGSSDDTPLVARSFGPPVVCWSRARGGVASARNEAAERAKGELIAFLDADDLWAVDKLARQSAALDGNADLEAVFCHVQQFSGPSAVVERRLGPPLPGYTPSAMLIRAEALQRIGPFNAGLPLAESLDWHLRATAAELRHIMLPDVLLYRRIHDENVGVRERDSQIGEYFRVLRAAVARKRSTAGT